MYNIHIVFILGFDSMLILMKYGRLRWFAQVERRNKEDWVSEWRDAKVRL